MISLSGKKEAQCSISGTGKPFSLKVLSVMLWVLELPHWDAECSVEERFIGIKTWQLHTQRPDSICLAYWGEAISWVMERRHHRIVSPGNESNRSTTTVLPLHQCFLCFYLTIAFLPLHKTPHLPLCHLSIYLLLPLLSYFVLSVYQRKSSPKENSLTNSMAYGTRRFNAAFTRALQ